MVFTIIVLSSTNNKLRGLDYQTPHKKIQLEKINYTRSDQSTATTYIEVNGVIVGLGLYYFISVLADSSLRNHFEEKCHSTDPI